jgi:hypothetical protein
LKLQWVQDNMTGREHGQLLPGAVVDRDWMDLPSNDPASGPPREWVEGLWGLDAAVRAAIQGGWTDDEITREVGQLVKSHRAESSSPDREGAENG